jgi:two-component system response regulator AtoC
MKLSPDALSILSTHAWPGNARELRNLIERLVLVNPDGVIEPEGLPGELHPGSQVHVEDHGPEQFDLNTVVREAEIKAIFRAYRHAKGNKAKTAEMLGISPRTLRHKVQEYALNLSRHDR